METFLKRQKAKFVKATSEGKIAPLTALPVEISLPGEDITQFRYCSMCNWNGGVALPVI
jgi:hypothetical protein